MRSGCRSKKVGLRGQRCCRQSDVCWGRFVNQAIENTRHKKTYIAACLQIGQPELSRMLSGRRPLSLAHLALLPLPVQQELATLIGESIGLVIFQAAETPQEASKALARALMFMMPTMVPLKAALTQGHLATTSEVVA